VLELIRADVAEDKVRIDNPTQNLESYFLDVVAKAKQAAAETSGAQSGGKVAAYLQAGAEAKPATDKVLERLTAPAPVKEVEQPAVAPASTVNQTKLDSLTRRERAGSETGAPTATPAPEAKPADLAKANEKLSSLLNKPKS